MAGVRVNSRAELEAFLREHPIQLRAGRVIAPRAGQPDFIGPLPANFATRRGRIDFHPTEGASFTIHKAPWERERDEKILRLLGEL
jgi:hypothetical protein